MSAKHNMETLGAHPKYQKVRLVRVRRSAKHTWRCPSVACAGTACSISFHHYLIEEGIEHLQNRGCGIRAYAAACEGIVASRLVLYSGKSSQIRDLNSGTFGFVELALDKSTGQQVAVKFIERGDKVLSVLLFGHGLFCCGLEPPGTLSCTCAGCVPIAIVSANTLVSCSQRSSRKA